MKKFRFPLRPVGVLRAHQETKAREAFAAAMQAHAASLEKLATLRARVAELEEILFQGRRDRFSAADTAAFFRAYRAECAAAMQAEHAVIAARAEMLARRADYLEANRKVKIISRLEEKARAAWRQDVFRAEQNAFDELAARRHADAHRFTRFAS